MENKLFKLLIRYIKEKKQYEFFKILFYKKFKEINPKIIEKLIEGKIIHRLPASLGLETGNMYWSPFMDYIYKENKKEVIKLFEDFLEKLNLKETFIENVDLNFFKKIVSDNATYEHLKINYDDEKTKMENFYDNLSCFSYVVWGFEWAKSIMPKETGIVSKYYKSEFWNNVNESWKEILLNFLYEKK